MKKEKEKEKKVYRRKYMYFIDLNEKKNQE